LITFFLSYKDLYIKLTNDLKKRLSFFGERLLDQYFATGCYIHGERFYHVYSCGNLNIIYNLFHYIYMRIYKDEILFSEIQKILFS